MKQNSIILILFERCNRKVFVNDINHLYGNWHQVVYCSGRNIKLVLTCFISNGLPRRFCNMHKVIATMFFFQFALKLLLIADIILEQVTLFTK